MEGKKLVGDYVAGGLALALALPLALALALDDDGGGGGGDGYDGNGVDCGAEELGVIEVTLS